MREGTVMMWMIQSVLSLDDEAVAASHQAGRWRQAIQGKSDRVGDEPRLTIDFTVRPPSLTTKNEPVGQHGGRTVSLFGEDYVLRRRRPAWLFGMRLTISSADEVVLTARAQPRTNGVIRTFDVRVAPDLDPVTALALVVLWAKPHRMGINLFG